MLVPNVYLKYSVLYPPYTYCSRSLTTCLYAQAQLKQQLTDQDANYQQLLQQEKNLNQQLQELHKEKETIADELKNAVAQKEVFEQQLTELKAQVSMNKDENDGSTSPEIIPSNFSFGSSDIQVQYIIAYIHVHVLPPVGDQ